MTVLWDSPTYQDFLKSSLDVRGQKSQLAHALKVKTSYISQVLSGKCNLTSEQAIETATFLGLRGSEIQYFYLSVCHARAGTPVSRQFLKRQLDAQLEKRKSIKARILQKQTLKEDVQSIYYSHWLYATVHILVSIPALQTASALAEKLVLPVEQIKDVLHFLVEAELIVAQGKRYRLTEKRIHLSHASPFIQSHHTQWRLKTLESLGRRKQMDLHYSSILTMSQKDAEKIREILLRSLEDSEKIMTTSPEEIGVALCMDFFQI